MTIVTYTDSFEAGAGASGTREIKTMSEAQSFELREAVVYGEGSFDNRVDIQVLFGSERVLPREGSLAAFTEPMSGVAERTYESGDTISIYYNNQDGATAHNVFIILKGDESTDGGV